MVQNHNTKTTRYEPPTQYKFNFNPHQHALYTNIPFSESDKRETTKQINGSDFKLDEERNEYVLDVEFFVDITCGLAKVINISLFTHYSFYNFYYLFNLYTDTVFNYFVYLFPLFIYFFLFLPLFLGNNGKSNKGSVQQSCSLFSKVKHKGKNQLVITSNLVV